MEIFSQPKIYFRRQYKFFAEYFPTWTSIGGEGWSNTEVHVNWSYQVEGTAGFSKEKKEKIRLLKTSIYTT